MTQASLFHQFLQTNVKLPTLPGIAVRILELVHRGDSSLSEIAEVIATDPPLSAEVLKVTNSSYFGLRHKVTSVSQAASLLGTTLLKNLALSFSLFKCFKNGSKEPFDYEQFWKYSLISAVANRFIVERLLPDKAEEAFFLGLLHDIGILFLRQSMPKQFSMILHEMKRSGNSFFETENHLLGFSHMNTGEHLVKSWGLPESFYKPIGNHHKPKEIEHKCSNDIYLLTSALHLASRIATLLNSRDKSLHLGMADLYIEQTPILQDLKIEEITRIVQKEAESVFPLFEFKMKAKDNYIHVIEEARKGLIELSQDLLTEMIEQKRQIEILQERATSDGLTSLMNYQAFQDILEKEISRSKRHGLPLSLILADIDYFKKVNDTYGHLAGDSVLKRVAALLKDGIRISDSACRYGGEEFAVLLPETDGAGGMILAERLRAQVSSTAFFTDGHRIKLSMSFGVAEMVNRNDFSNADLLKRADRALYEAKRAGRNTCYGC
jgi:diguanylate cyclase (GGDEF)-like protein